MKYSQKQECLRHLQDTFGLAGYRPGQKEAVYTLLSGRDVLCVLPTGAGKSLCWQLPAIIRRELTVVVSPLISLMRDQVEHLHSIGIPAVSLDSLMSHEEKDAAFTLIRNGAVRIVYVSPERLMQQRFRQLCQEIQPWLVVVDEAHCVVQWGDGFRPAYTEIPSFIHCLPKRPVLCALTATADDTMRHAIDQQLHMIHPKRIVLPVIRENLMYETKTSLDRTQDILRLCIESPSKTVIFCRSRARTELLARLITGQGIACACYHAGLARDVRLATQQQFMDGSVQVLCATTAFGLGVDIPDIRRIIHDYLPDDLIDYVQQSGRAGRDGMPAKCIVLIEPNELVRKAAFRSYAKNAIRRWMERYRYLRKAKVLIRILMTEKCIPAGISSAFGKRTDSCGRCSACGHGSLVKRVPSDAFRSIRRMRLWLLCWQRDALAAQKKCSPRGIVSDSAILIASKKLVFPEGASGIEALERLLTHFRK